VEEGGEVHQPLEFRILFVRALWRRKLLVGYVA
jgi:hypothetical protein